MRILITVALCAALLVGGVYLSWTFTRQIHYNLVYKSMVEKTVRDMVKPEALKSPPTEGKRQ